MLVRGPPACFGRLFGEDDAVVLLLKPLLGIRLGDLVARAHLALALLPPRDSLARPLKDDEEIHAWKRNTK